MIARIHELPKLSEKAAFLVNHIPAFVEAFRWGVSDETLKEQLHNNFDFSMIDFTHAVNQCLADETISVCFRITQPGTRLEALSPHFYKK